MKDDGLCIDMVEGGSDKKDSHGTLYVKDVIETARKQITFCSI